MRDTGILVFEQVGGTAHESSRRRLPARPGNSSNGVRQPRQGLGNSTRFDQLIPKLACRISPHVFDGHVAISQLAARHAEHRRGPAWLELNQQRTSESRLLEHRLSAGPNEMRIDRASLESPNHERSSTVRQPIHTLRAASIRLYPVRSLDTPRHLDVSCRIHSLLACGATEPSVKRPRPARSGPFLPIRAATVALEPPHGAQTRRRPPMT